MDTDHAPLQQLLDHLATIDPERFEVDRIADLVAAAPLTLDDVREYVRFSDERYGRQVVRRGHCFEMLVLSWKPGQVTPVHDHDGQRGWVRVLAGAVEERTFIAPDLRRGGNLAAAGVDIDDDGVGCGIRLEPTGDARVSAGPGVATVDRDRPIHRISNPLELGTDAVTLHIYSRPYDSCLVFDPEREQCRRELVGEQQPSS